LAAEAWKALLAPPPLSVLDLWEGSPLQSNFAWELSAQLLQENEDLYQVRGRVPGAARLPPPRSPCAAALRSPSALLPCGPLAPLPVQRAKAGAWASLLVLHACSVVGAVAGLGQESVAIQRAAAAQLSLMSRILDPSTRVPWRSALGPGGGGR